VRVNVAERIVVEKVGGHFGPNFVGDVVPIDGALLAERFFWLSVRDATVDVEGSFMDDCGVELALNRLFGMPFVLFFGP